MASVSTSAPSASPSRTVFALIRRDFLITRSYRLALVLDLFFGFLNLLVYYFISRTFGDAAGEQLGAAPTYFAFATVGIAITVVLQAATAGLAHRVREEQLTGTLEALVTQPLTAAQMAVGLAGLPLLFAIGRAAFYILLAGVWLGVDFSRASWAGFLVMIVATGAAMSAIGILSGALVLLVKRGEILVAMATFGMGLLGGAVFPVSVLPGWLEPLSKLVPTRYAFDGVRAAIFEGAHWAADALALLLFSAVAVPLVIVLFAQALALSKRRGSLSQY